MTRRGLMGLLAASATVLFSGCNNPSEELRYRLTVEVDTPQGLRTGSSVIEVRGSKGPDWAAGISGGGGTRASFKGEAVAVDLPGGNTLFALLRTPSGTDAAEYPYFAFEDRLKSSPDWLESMRRMQSWRGETAEMKGTEGMHGNNETVQVSVLPMLVRFKDIKDPKSVEQVEPSALAASFGAGVRLKRITVAVTEDAVTRGIGERLGWLDNLDNYRTDPSNPFTNTLPNEIGGFRSN